jgi:hypothetical protein
MTAGTCPVIPYEKQEDPRSNRMCGAACLSMVYRSLAERGGGDPAPKRGRDRRTDAPFAPRGKERRAGRRRAEELGQTEIWKQISRPNASGTLSAATHLIVAHARSRRFAAVAVQARYPLVALLACRDNGIRAILNHRLHAGTAAGHYTVLLDVDAESVVVHDPYYGPRRRIPHAELLELWQPRFPGSEIAGNVLIGIGPRPSTLPLCPLCDTPIPEQVACPRCGKPVRLSPPELLGCVGPTECLARLWNYLDCPSCDSMWSFAMTPEAPEPAPDVEEGPWQLGPLFAELDRFRDRALSVPGVAARADVRQQLDFIEPPGRRRDGRSGRGTASS